MLFSIKNFSCSCACSSYNINEFYSSCNVFSYEFSNNVYLLQGEIDSGAWSFANSISSHCKRKYINKDSRIYFNGNATSLKEIENITCYIHVKPKIRDRYITFSKAIKNAIHKYNFKYSYYKLMQLFEIPEYIFDKKISNLGVYYPCYVTIIGLIKGKKIFTCAWQGQYGFDSNVFAKIGKALKSEKLLLIIPTSKKNTFPDYCIKLDMLSLFNYELQNKYR